MSGFSDVKIWAMFVEDEKHNHIAASFRSRDFNINKVALKYHGGGHKLASGCKVLNKKQFKNCLEDLQNLID